MSLNHLFLGDDLQRACLDVQVKRLLRHGPLQDAEVSWDQAAAAVISLEIGNIFRSRSSNIDIEACYRV